MLWLGIYLPFFGLEVARRSALHGSMPVGSMPVGSITDGSTQSRSGQDRSAQVVRQPSPQSADAGDHANGAGPEVLIHDQVVVASNPAAQALGIQPGVSLATAQSLVPDTLRHFPQDRQHEQARLAFLGEVLYRFSADVSLETPDAIVLEAGRSLNLFGNIQTLGAQVTEACRQLGHTTQIRAGATPLAALALARTQASTLPQVALDRLGLPDKVVERFANMGLITLGQVMALPHRELAHRFGRDFANHLLRLTGDLPDPRVHIRPRRQFSQALHLLEPLRDKAALQWPMTRLLEELSQWLISHQLGAEAINWSFAAHAAHTRVSMPIRFARARQEVQTFLGISELKLTETELPEDVLSIGLQARRLRPWIGQATTLFPDMPVVLPGIGTGSHQGSHRGDPVECTELLDQLGARLGEQACLRLQAIDCHAPELAWRPLPLQATSSSRQPHLPPIRPGQRPLWVFTPPRPVAIADLTLLDGPERIQSQWWEGPVIRDYYVANHHNGARCWVFVEQTGLTDTMHKWYLHGYFA